VKPPKTANWKQQQKELFREKRFRRAAGHGSPGNRLFRNANWAGLKFSKTAWKDEDFSGSNLVGADFSRCSFAGTDLTNAKLWNANLEEADLTGAAGLLGEQLAGANLTRAKLPPEIATFPGIEQVKALSENSAKVFLTMLAVIAFTVLTIASSNDLDLFVSHHGTTLPLIGIQIPLLGFHIVMPILLVLIYLYLQLYLQRLWETLSRMPAILPDGRRLDESTHPWLLNDLVRDYFPILRRSRTPRSLLQSWLSRLLAWWFVPITLWFLWANGLRAQLGLLTLWQIAAVTLATGAAIWFHFLLRPTFRFPRFAGPRVASAIEWRGLRIAFVGTVGMATLLWLGTFEVSNYSSLNRFTITPNVLHGLGVEPFPHLENAEFSLKPPTWTGMKQFANKEIALVRGAQIYYRKICNARADNAFLVNSLLQGPDLRESDFRRADFRGAHMRDVSAVYAYFGSAQFSGRFDQTSLAHYETSKLTEKTLQLTFYHCNFTRTRFLDAFFDGTTAYRCTFDAAILDGLKASSRPLFIDCSFAASKWENATLGGATFVCSEYGPPIGTNLRASTFAAADCREVNFGKCDLTQAIFKSAVLARADLRNATGLTSKQLQEAGNLNGAQLPPDLARDLSDRIVNDASVEPIDLLEEKERAAEPKLRD
jgi:uncharacterized protein YjbI with pentapeptide repeats